MDEELAALEAGASAEAPRQYIDREGTHYLRLKEYLYLDGTGHKETKGPCFVFEVEQSPAYPKGDVRSKVLALNALGRDAKSTRWARQAKGRECLEMVGALFAARGGVPPDDLSKVLQLIRDTDKFASAFVGAVVRCDAVNKTKTSDGVVKTYTNCTWHADDRD